MKLLVVLGSVYPDADANSKIIFQLLDYLQQAHGVSCDILAICPNGDCSDATYQLGQRTVQRINPSYTKLLQYNPLPNNAFLAKTLPRLVRLCKNPKVALAVHRATAKPEYDCTLFVCAPFTTLKNIKFAHKSANKLVFQLDPYASHFSLDAKEKAVRLREEEAFYREIHAAFLPELLRQDNLANGLGQFADKMIPYEFPNICQNDAHASQHHFSKQSINCVFIGTMYPAIRSPQYLFDLMQQMGDPQIKLFFFGRIVGEDQDAFLSRMFAGKYAALQSQISFCGAVPTDQAMGIMNDADILINIGNTVPNQMPSKILDYISTGNPIVNICKLDNCPTLHYTAQYPCCLTLRESQGASPAAARQFADFCQQAKGKKLPFAHVQALYPHCTAEYVGEQLYTALCNAKQKNTTDA